MLVPSTPPTGIVLFNLGGPETLADVEPFLVRLFSDREITAADACRIREYRRPEALNTHPLFIESLARQVESHLGIESPRSGSVVGEPVASTV